METHTKNYGSVIEGPITSFTSPFEHGIGKRFDRSRGVYEYKFDDIKVIKGRNAYKRKTSDICKNINKVIFAKMNYYPGSTHATKERFTMNRCIIHIMIKYSTPISGYTYSSQTDHIEIKFIDNHGCVYSSEMSDMQDYSFDNNYNYGTEHMHSIRLGAFKVLIYNHKNTISKDTDPLPNKIIDFIKKYSSFDIPDYSTNSEFYKDLIGITKEIPCGDLLSLEDDEIPEKETPSGDLLSLEDD